MGAVTNITDYADYTLTTEETRNFVEESQYLLGVEDLAVEGRAVCRRTVETFFAPGEQEANAYEAREHAVRVKLARMVGASSWESVAGIAAELYHAVDGIDHGEAIALARRYAADRDTVDQERLVDAIPEARNWSHLRRVAPQVAEAYDDGRHTEAMQAAERIGAEQLAIIAAERVPA